MKNKLKTILIKIGLSLFIIILYLMIGELIARIPAGIPPQYKFYAPCVVDSEMGYIYKSNWSGDLELLSGRKYKLRINSMGIKERELPLKKSKNTLRLLFLGDSITFGTGVEADKTFVRIVEDSLNVWKNSQFCRFETINTGVDGYNTYNEIALLKKIGIKYQPDIVILDFYLSCVEPTTSVEEIKKIREAQILQIKFGLPLPFKEFLRQKSMLYIKVCLLYYNLIGKIKKLPIPTDTSTVGDWKNNKVEFFKLIRSADLDWGRAWGKEAYYENFRKYIRKIKDLSKENNFKLVIICFPVKYQLETEFLEDTPQKRLAIIADEENIPFLNLLPLMREYKCTKPEKLYIDHCHLTPEGHKFVAGKIAEFLKNLKI